MDGKFDTFLFHRLSVLVVTSHLGHIPGGYKRVSGPGRKGFHSDWLGYLALLVESCQCHDYGSATKENDNDDDNNNNRDDNNSN